MAAKKAPLRIGYRIAQDPWGRHEGFLPFFSVRRSWHSAGRDVSLPLLPHFVFCRMDPKRRLPILQIPSVRTIVSFEPRAIPVDEFEIQSVRAMIGSGLLVAPHDFLSSGARVRVTVGPLSGIEGIPETFRVQDRLVVSLALLERSVSVEIQRQHVVPSPRQAVGAQQQSQ